MVVGVDVGVGAGEAGCFSCNSSHTWYDGEDVLIQRCVDASTWPQVTQLFAFFVKTTT